MGSASVVGFGGAVGARFPNTGRGTGGRAIHKETGTVEWFEPFSGTQFLHEVAEVRSSRWGLG